MMYAFYRKANRHCFGSSYVIPKMHSSPDILPGDRQVINRD
jgi:hypothetical protein